MNSQEIFKKIDKLNAYMKLVNDKNLKRLTKDEIRSLKIQLKSQVALEKLEQKKIKYRSGPIISSCNRNFLPMLDFVRDYFNQYSKTLLDSDLISLPRDLSVVLCFGDSSFEYNVISSANYFKKRDENNLIQLKREYNDANNLTQRNQLKVQIVKATSRLRDLRSGSQKKSKSEPEFNPSNRFLCDDGIYSGNHDSCYEYEEKESELYINHELDEWIDMDECQDKRFFEGDEGYGVIITDQLGCYQSYKLNNKYSFTGNHKKGKIVLYCKRIFEVAKSFGVNGHALFEIVLVHELAHAYHHLGFDENQNSNEVFSNMATTILEGYANYMTWHYINVFLNSFFDITKTARYKFAMTDTEMLNEAFLNATKQTGRYGVYKGFLSRNYSLGLINRVNASYRETDIKSIQNFKTGKRLFSLKDFDSRARYFESY